MLPAGARLADSAPPRLDLLRLRCNRRSVCDDSRRQARNDDARQPNSADACGSQLAATISALAAPPGTQCPHLPACHQHASVTTGPGLAPMPHIRPLCSPVHVCVPTATATIVSPPHSRLLLSRPSAPTCRAVCDVVAASAATRLLQQPRWRHADSSCAVCLRIATANSRQKS